MTSIAEDQVNGEVVGKGYFGLGFTASGNNPC